MKKFFLIAAAAAMVLSSCSKNTVSEDTSEANAIGFGTYTGRSITKADGSFVNNDVKTNLPNGSVFHVLGYAATTNLTATNFKDNFQFGDVTFSGTAYTYATKYWPKAAGIQISCYAYYPVSSNVTAAAPSSNLGSYTVTAPADPTKQSDFMISDVEPDMTYSTSKTISGSTKDGEVAILFHHMLSQVGVKVKLDQVVDGIDVTVKSIDFMNLYSKGVCTPSYDPDPTKPVKERTSFVWSGQNTKYTGNISLPMPTTPVVLNGTEFKSVADGNSAALLLIPQTIPSGTKIAHIVFTVDDHTTQKDVPADITTTSDSELVLGTRLTYNVTFKLFYDSSDEGGKYAITFTAQVAPWTDASQSVTL
jgi:hypothetical protein